MTIGEVIRKQKELYSLYDRLQMEQAKIPDGGTMTISENDLIDCIQCVSDCIRFINKTNVRI